LKEKRQKLKGRFKMNHKSTLNIGLIIAVSFFLAIFMAFPQVVNAVRKEWVRTYDGPGKGEDLAYDIALDTNGNVYVTGTDFITIKYDGDGVRKWGKRYYGPVKSGGNASAVAVDTNGNVYVTGYTDNPGGNVGNTDYATIKYNSAGVRQWVRRYDGPGKGEDWPTAIAVDTDGNVYVTGYSENTDGNEDYATIKYNSAGVRQWIRRYDGPGKGKDRATAIALDNNGDVCITGVCINANFSLDYATIKYSSDGVGQWVRRYDGTGKGPDYATDIAVDTDDNVYVTGFSGNVKDNLDFATIMYSSDGVRQWVMRYDGPGKWMDHARAIAVDTNGNVYVTGSIYNAAFNSDYATIKYAP
jgi:uncharacterized delta-60 repeat protein